MKIVYISAQNLICTIAIVQDVLTAILMAIIYTEIYAIFVQRGRNTVRFLKPKEKKLQKVDWQVSEQVIDMVKVYSEYTDYTESEVVEFFLKQIREDVSFLEWILKKRNNKKLLKLFELENREKEE